VPHPGAKGHRPTAGTRDGKGLLDAFAAVTAVTAAPHTNTLEHPAGTACKDGRSKARRPQGALAAHLRHVGRQYPRASTSGRCRPSKKPPGMPVTR
jgi:hypothetical protein